MLQENVTHAKFNDMGFSQTKKVLEFVYEVNATHARSSDIPSVAPVLRPDSPQKKSGFADIPS